MNTENKYINITTSTITRATIYMDEHWIKPEDTPIKKHVGSRLCSLALAPASVITSAADTIVGIFAGFGSIFTLGLHRPTYICAARYLASSPGIVSRPFAKMIKVLNPSAFLEYSKKKKEDGSAPDKAFIQMQGKGLITHYVFNITNTAFRSCANSEYWLMRHVVSRLTLLLSAVAHVISRVVDAIIGSIAAVFAFLTLGKVDSINHAAHRGLQLTGIIHDVFYHTMHLINPWAGEKESI